MTKNQLLRNKYRVLQVRFWIEKHCLVKHFAFLKNLCYQYFCALNNLMFFMSFWLAHNQISWNVLLFSSNLICKLCLSGPCYKSRSLSDVNNTIILNCDLHPPLVSVHLSKETTWSEISHFNFFPVKGLNLTSTKGDQH